MPIARAAAPPGRPTGRTSPTGWTFLTNHAHVLVCLAADPDLRLREVAERVGITERAVQLIVGDLENAGILTRTREGRRNHYALRLDVPLRHPVEAHVAVADLLGTILPQRAPGQAGAAG